MQISFFERLKSVRNDLKLSLHSPMVSLKKKSASLIKYYIKVTCAFTWARKLPRKTVTYESAYDFASYGRRCRQERDWQIIFFSGQTVVVYEPRLTSNLEL